MPDLKWTRLQLTWFVRGLYVISAVLALVSWFGWEHVNVIFDVYEPKLRAIGYLLGPILAVAGFIAATKGSMELAEQAAKAGAQEKAAHLAEERAKAAEAMARHESDEAKKLRAELEGITTGADQLWKLRPARPFPQFREWYLERRAVLVTIGNLKGGVGKTTLAANFAAYLSEALYKKVLLVDLDYQGSLSTMLLGALAREPEPSRVNALFDTAAGLSELLQARTQLVPDNTFNRGLTRAWLVPAGYEYSTLENRLLLSWLLDKQQDIDVRYRLAHVLLQPDVQKEYDVIIFDLPPRLTMGAINALVASHYFFAPTVLDRISSDSIPQFLEQVKAIKSDLDLGIELGGIIGTLTRADDLSLVEVKYLDRARTGGHVWQKDVDFVLPRTVPRRAAISNVAGEEIAYIVRDNQARQGIRHIFDPLFEDMSIRIGVLNNASKAVL